MPEVVTVTPSSVSFSTKLTAAQLAAVIGAITGAVTLSGLPAGKTLADAKNLNINKIEHGPDAGGATVNGSIAA